MCHTCYLYDYQTLYCNHKEIMFCNCCYLKIYCRWLCLYVDVFHKCNKEKPVVLLPSLCFGCSTLLKLMVMVYRKLYDQCSLGVDESEVYFVVSWSLSGAYTVFYLAGLNPSCWFYLVVRIAILNPQALHIQLCAESCHLYVRPSVLVPCFYILAYRSFLEIWIVFKLWGYNLASVLSHAS